MFTEWHEHSLNKLNPMKFWNKDTFSIPVSITRKGKTRKYNCKFYSYGRVAHLYYANKKYNAIVHVDFSEL